KNNPKARTEWAVETVKKASVLVEGGAFTLQQFIDAQLWDEIRLLKTASELSEGVLAPKIRAQPLKKVSLQKDALHLFRNKALMPQTNF
ncbi:MAG: hypothetical protein ACPHL7_01830, partial [Flavobacteriaceae bacterium]